MAFKSEILLFVVVAVAFYGTANASQKECPKIGKLASFDVAAFSGQWFDIKRTKTLVDAFRGSCSSVTFATNDKKNITIAMSTKINGKMVTTRSHSVMDADGALDWGFNVGPLKFELDYSVVSTDNTNYAAMLACGNVPVVGPMQMVWIYGRKNTLEKEYVDKAIADLKAKNIDVSNLVDADQKNCY